jgi:O-antigen ligase
MRLHDLTLQMATYPATPSRIGSAHISNAGANPPGVLQSLILGLAAFTTTPPEGSADFLRIQIGAYLITYFEFAVALGALVLFSNLRVHIRSEEKKVVRVLLVIIAARIISLLAASSMVVEQVVSVLRYIETLVVIVILSNLLQAARNRFYFVIGIMIGAVIETCGGLWILLTSSGDTRGFWLGIDNYKWQVYLLFVCMLFLSAKKHILLSGLLAIILLSGIVATQTRAALVLLLIVAGVSVLSYRRKLLKPLLVSGLLVSIGVAPIMTVFPDIRDAMRDRIEQLWSGGGVIGYRVVLFEMAASAFLSHPITGIGSGGFARQQDVLYLDINDAFTPEYETAYGNLSTHNTVLGVAAETGVIGLCAHFAWLWVVSRICLDTLKMKAANRDTFLVAACVLMIGFMFQDFWGQASFLASSSCILGFILGWRRGNNCGSPSIRPAPQRQLATT